MRSGRGGRFIEAAQKPIVAALSGCSIAIYLLYHLTRFQVAPRGDASIIFDQARNIFERAAYPSNTIFPYPPSAVLVFYGLSTVGPAIFMAAWLLIGVVSIFIADAPISWDLRNANSNLMCLGLLLAGYGLLGRLPALAGMLIGLAFSIKVYSGLLLLYLFVNGPRRAIGAAGIMVFILWLGLPLGLFGTDGALRLYSGWSEARPGERPPHRCPGILGCAYDQRVSNR